MICLRKKSCVETMTFTFELLSVPAYIALSNQTIDLSLICLWTMFVHRSDSSTAYFGETSMRGHFYCVTRKDVLAIGIGRYIACD